MTNFTPLILSIIGLIISICFLIMVLYDKYKTKKHPNPDPYMFIALMHVIGFTIILIKILI